MSCLRLAAMCAVAVLSLTTRLAGQAPGTRVDSLLRAMTLDEKLSFLHGAPDPEHTAGAGYLPGVPRLGIPPLRLTDGPAGVRTAQPATALPAPVMLSATFDTALARRFGTVLGREGRARDHDVLLAPMVNIVRVPQGGRDFETLGEDPLLAARLVAAEIGGIQAEGMLATAKHYVANNFERDRFTVDAVIDERTLHEIYLPGFEAAVHAGAAAVMCAYNQVNGAYACDSAELLTDVLRRQFGFAGWVMTDWGARHSLGALEAGLDQEMPGGSGSARQPVYFGDSLRAAVLAGRVPETAVTGAVRHILEQMNRMHLLGPGVAPRPAIDTAADAAIARDVALAGAVLLRNERATLPLTQNDLASLAVIGPTAQAELVGGGGSSAVIPFHTESPLAVLQRRAGPGARIHFAAGIDLDGVVVPAAVLTPAGATVARGLLRTAPDGATRVDTAIDYTGPSALPPGTRWTWSGTLAAPATGDYELKLQTRGGGGALTLDGARVLATGGFPGDASPLPTAAGLANATATVSLTAGAAHEIGITMTGRGEGPLEVRLAWVTPERRRMFLDEAVAAARAAHATVVFAFDPSTEGRDRASLALPGTQDALVAAAAGANRRTTVVLTTGAPVLMPWLDKTGAVLEMWYPGQEGGDATAALLLGQANPGGKLPVTFPRSEEQTPIGGSAERYPGVDGRATYGEGLLVGYRWYDAQNVEPLFPFGHGLSYTTFAYSGLAIAPSGDGFDVTFRVRNSGAAAGAEVPQVYLGPPANPPAPIEPKRLAGFARITLRRGEERAVTIHVGRREWSYWSTATHHWVVAPGPRPAYVGSSSRDIRLRGALGS
jgi:beta-glucosidase